MLTLRPRIESGAGFARCASYAQRERVSIGQLQTDSVPANRFCAERYWRPTAPDSQRGAAYSQGKCGRHARPRPDWRSGALPLYFSGCVAFSACLLRLLPEF
jgi:hypothetical protein